MSYVWIATGSALGGMARYWCSGLIAHRIGETFPWGTIAVNVIGSFVIGILAALAEPEGRIFISSSARQFLMIGLCGGFTTFSAFSLQTLALLREGDALRAGANVVLSVAFCLIAVWIGYVLASSLNELRGI
ncbi:MAG: fluoride efflux transporter CrcB [Gammaproteobacteria bacterium]